MITFVLLAAVLTVAGVALIAVPLLKKTPVEYSPAPWAALTAAGVLAIGSTVLYVRWTNWSWHTASAEDTPQTMVARLARRLERNPQDLEGWLMLGRSYSVLQEYQLALRAFQRADRLAGGQNADALIGQAEALALTDESELDRRARRLIEQALALDPQSGKALFFGAAAAMRRGELPLARERFAKLLSLNPPENIKPLLQKQIESIDHAAHCGTTLEHARTEAVEQGIRTAAANAVSVEHGKSDHGILHTTVRHERDPDLDAITRGKDGCGAIVGGQKLHVVDVNDANRLRHPSELLVLGVGHGAQIGVGHLLRRAATSDPAFVEPECLVTKPRHHVE